MGLPRPDARDLDGDESVLSPRQSDSSLLAARRGTDETKRIEADDSGNIYVRVAADDTAGALVISPLAVGAATNVSDNTLTTIATYTAGAAVKISKVVAGGTNYAKYQLFLNTVLIETRRTGPGRVAEFQFEDPLGLASSDVLDIKVTHYVGSELNDFEATIYGV